MDVNGDAQFFSKDQPLARWNDEPIVQEKQVEQQQSRTSSVTTVVGCCRLPPCGDGVNFVVYIISRDLDKKDLCLLVGISRFL